MCNEDNFEFVKDDFVKNDEDISLIDSDYLYYLIAEDKEEYIGCFFVRPITNIIYDCHVAFNSESRRRKALICGL